MTLLLAALLAVPVGAQVDFGTSLGPEAFLQGDRLAKESAPILPMAIATSLAFDATTWAVVEASTVPAKDVTALLRRGYYKLEVIQAVLVASGARVPLKDILAEHDKGKGLRQIAEARQVDFDAVYEEARRADRRVVDELLPSIMTVSVGRPPEERRRPRSKPEGKSGGPPRKAKPRGENDTR